MSVGCLELSVGCLDLSVGCLDLSFGCLDLSFGCLDLSFGCLDLSFRAITSSCSCNLQCNACDIWNQAIRPNAGTNHRKKQKSIDFSYFFGLFSKYLAPSGAKYCKKGFLEGYVGRIRDSSGHLKSANPDFSDFGPKLVNFGQLLPYLFFYRISWPHY